MYEYFEHTADVGLRLRAPDLETLLEEAGRALSGLIVENLDDVRPDQNVTVRVDQTGDGSGDLDYLLFDWLSALIREFEHSGIVLCEWDVARDSGGFVGACRGESLDPTRHRLGHEVKAVTYHELRLVRTADGWEGQAIVDL